MQLPGRAGVQLAQEINNELKKAVDAHPDRFRALAELPLHQPEEAIKSSAAASGEDLWAHWSKASLLEKML